MGIFQGFFPLPSEGLQSKFTECALSFIFRPEPQQKAPSAPPPPPPPPPPPLPEATPPEPEEEILGSDDEEQEDPADYCKGVCNLAASLRVNIVLQVLTLILGRFLETWLWITEFAYELLLILAPGAQLSSVLFHVANVPFINKYILCIFAINTQVLHPFSWCPS